MKGPNKDPRFANQVPTLPELRPHAASRTPCKRLGFRIVGFRVLGFRLRDK